MPPADDWHGDRAGQMDFTTSYSGDDSCMGKFSGGAMTLTRSTTPNVVRR